MAHNIPGQLSYLDSCRTWTVVAPGQLSYLDSCRTWTVVTWTVVAWTVVAWTDVGASKKHHQIFLIQKSYYIFFFGRTFGLR